MLNFLLEGAQHHNLFTVCLTQSWAELNVEIDQVILEDSEGIFLLKMQGLRGFNQGDSMK